MNFKLSKGFTLIELLVVIAIISLLSSVILAALKDTRDKAKASAFRQEINEFIKALELYKINTGNYPGNSNILATANNEGTISLIDDDNLSSALLPYIKKIPVATSGSNSEFFYYPDSSLYDAKCSGDDTYPAYLIGVTATERAVSDWPFIIYGGVEDQNFKCFSLK